MFRTQVRKRRVENFAIVEILHRGANGLRQISFDTIFILDLVSVQVIGISDRVLCRGVLDSTKLFQHQ